MYLPAICIRLGALALAEWRYSASKSPGRSFSNAEIQRVEGEILADQKTGNLPIVDVPVEHRFTAGIYTRKVVMPAGSLIIGHEHKTQHENFAMRGRALVSMNGVVSELTGPYVFTSEPGTRKVLIILEEMEFATVHPNPDEIRDIDTLEEMFITKSPEWHKYAEDIDRLKFAASLQNP